MQITLSKKTAKTLDKAIWLFVMTCNKNKYKKNTTFKPSEEIMKEMGVSRDEIIAIHEIHDQIEEKLNK